MGFYLRKNVRVGPIRFNLSKSGIGVSAGIKGFRVGSGPRGNYVHMGRGGLYYRATISPVPRSQVHCQPHEQTSPTQPPGTTHDPLHEIESGDVFQMQDSSSAALLKELNSKHRTWITWPYAIVLSTVAIVVFRSSNSIAWLAIPIAVFAFLLALYLYHRDQLRKTTVLLYEMEPSVEQAYQAVHDAFDGVLECAAAWHIGAEGNVRDRKYHAGASTLVQRKTVRAAKGQPPYVKTNLVVPLIPVGKRTLYFFPDRLLVFAANGVGAISYESLALDVSQTRFIEEENVPHDSTVVDHTWKYVNKKGGPDRRFKNNRQLPIALYEQVLFASSSGLNELIQLSKIGLGLKLNQAVAALAACCQQSIQAERPANKGRT